MHFQIIKWSPSTHLVTWFEALWGGLSLLMISEVEGFWGDPGGWEREVEGTFWGPSQGVGGYLSDRWPQCGGCRGDWCPWWCCTLHEGHSFLRRLLMLMSAISIKFICQNFMLMKNTTYKNWKLVENLPNSTRLYCAMFIEIISLSLTLNMQSISCNNC